MRFILAVKRLMKEAAELKDPTDHYHAQPLEVSFLFFPHIYFKTLKHISKNCFAFLLL